VISGSKARVKLPRGSGEHIFRFELIDKTKRNVLFNGFGAEQGEDCPSQPVNNMQQEIVNVSGAGTKSAEFTDRNNGRPVTFCYTWFFRCDDKKQTPIFDPIVDNGGR
jgi:hypothetical protein